MLKNKRNKGITLIALVITIIILLIIAGIAISQLTESGLFNKTQVAKDKYSIEEEKEQLEIEIANLKMQMYANNTKNTTTLDNLKTYLESDKFNGEYTVELFYEPLAATENVSVAPVYAKVTHLPTKFVFYVDGKLVVIGEKTEEEEKNTESMVTLYANGGTFQDNTTEKTITYTGKKITLPSVSKPNVTFKGWYASDLTTKIGNIGDEVEVTNNMKLYALYYTQSVSFEPTIASDTRILHNGFSEGTLLDAFRIASYPGAYGWGNPTYVGLDFETPVYVYGYYCQLRATRCSIDYTDDLSEDWTSAVTNDITGAAYGTSVDETISNFETNGAHRYWRLRVISGAGDYKPMIWNLHFRTMN